MLIAKIFLADIHRYTEMYLAYELTSLLAKFFLANSFYLYGLPKFSPTKYFPCTVTYIIFRAQAICMLIDYMVNILIVLFGCA